MTGSYPPPDGGYTPREDPPPPPPPYPGYPPPFPGQFPREGPPWTQTPPSSPLAIIALVLAILPLGFTWLIAIVLAIVVLAGKQRAAGRGMAIGALVVSFVWIAFAAVGTTLLVHHAKRYDDARAAGSGTIWVDMVRTGDCLHDLPRGEVIDELVITPCSGPHRAEVFRVFPIEPSTHPTQADIDQLADIGCHQGFEEFVGVPVERSELYIKLIDSTPDDVGTGSDVI